MKKIVDRMMYVFLICGFVTIACVCVITVYLIISGLPAIEKIGISKFLFGKVWASTAKQPEYGILPFILTSIYGTIGAILIGVPIGFFTAVYLAKFAPAGVKKSVGFVVSLLVSMQSILRIGAEQFKKEKKDGFDIYCRR